MVKHLHVVLDDKEYEKLYQYKRKHHFYNWRNMLMAILRKDVGSEV